jgi:hypothetical protein
MSKNWHEKFVGWAERSGDDYVELAKNDNSKYLQLIKKIKDLIYCQNRLSFPYYKTVKRESSRFFLNKTTGADFQSALDCYISELSYRKIK